MNPAGKQPSLPRQVSSFAMNHHAGHHPATIGQRALWRPIGKGTWLAACLFLFAAQPAAAVQDKSGATTPLPEAVQTALTRAGIPASAVSVGVAPLDSGGHALGWQDTQPMNPASVMKLVTAFAAFDLLGRAFVWDTEVLLGPSTSEHPPNLYLRSRGDPMLTGARLRSLLSRIHAFGITRIGDLVIDEAGMRFPPHDAGAFDAQPLRPYNSGGYALPIDFNALAISLMPGDRVGDPVRLAPEPALAGLQIDADISTAAGGCPSRWSRQFDIALDTQTRPHRLAIKGQFPRACGTRQWSVSPYPANEFSQRMVDALWQSVGGQRSGVVRTGMTPPEARPLIADNSPGLADVLREMNKWSSNLIARQVLATLGDRGLPLSAGDDPSRSPDVEARGRQAARSSLGAHGIDTRTLVLDNGAGLSRDARIPAASLLQLLKAAWAKPWRADFVASLPAIGVDGTARRRLRDTPASGHAMIKTGTLNEVSAMAGYLLDRHGRWHAIVMMVNHPAAQASKPAQDALIQWLWQGT